MSSDENTAPNFLAMRQRASMLDGAGASAPPPAIMWKPGSQDEAAGAFKRVFKRLASTWKRRRVTVNPAMFQYADLDSDKVVGAIKTGDITAVRIVNRSVMKEFGSPDNLQDYGWMLAAGGRQYVFACESIATRDHWVGYLGSIVKQRVEDGLLNDGEDDNDDAQSRAVTAMSRARSSFDPEYARENLANVAANVMAANDGVFDDVARFKSRQYRKNAASDDGDDNQQHGDDDDDHDGGAAGHADDGKVLSGGLKEHLRGYKRDIDENGNEIDGGSRQDDDDGDGSSESEILVERGEELVAATVAELRAPRMDLLQIPGPNKNYRRENIVIEALFEDLRTQEPDHVRLLGLETPVAALSYFQPQLLRAAQDNDLPGDLPPKPLFVSEFLPRADNARPSLRHCSVPANRLRPLLQGLRKLEHPQFSPRGGAAASSANSVAANGTWSSNFVVDSEGMIVGCPSSVVDRPVAALSRAILARHAASSVFAHCATALMAGGWRHNATNNPAMASMVATPLLPATASTSPKKPPPATTHLGAPSAAAAAATNASTAALGATGRSVTFDETAVSFEHFGPTTASFAAPPAAAAANNSKPDSPTTSPAGNRPSAPFPSGDDDEAAHGAHAPPLQRQDSATMGRQESVTARIGNFLNHSIHAFRRTDTKDASPPHSASVAGGGMDFRRPSAGNEHSVAATAARHQQSMVGGSNLSFQSEKNAGAIPSVYGPVITIETTRRRILVTDMAYRSDVMQTEEAHPPLFLCSYVELPPPK